MWVVGTVGASINAVLSELAVGVVLDLARVSSLNKTRLNPYIQRGFYQYLGLGRCAGFALKSTCC